VEEWSSLRDFITGKMCIIPFRDLILNAGDGYTEGPGGHPARRKIDNFKRHCSAVGNGKEHVRI